MVRTNYEDVKDTRKQIDSMDYKKVKDSMKNSPIDSSVFLKNYSQEELSKQIAEWEAKDSLIDGKSAVKVAKEIYLQNFGGKEDF